MQKLSCEQVYNIWISEPNLIRIIDMRSRDAYEKHHIPGALLATMESLPTVICEQKNRLLVLFGDEAPSEALMALCGDDCVIMANHLEWFEKKYPSAGLQGAVRAADIAADQVTRITVETNTHRKTGQRAWLMIDPEAREFCILDAHDEVKDRWHELTALGYRLCFLFRSQGAAQSIDISLAQASKARICVPKEVADANTDIPLECGQEILFGDRLIRVLNLQKQQTKLGFEFCGTFISDSMGAFA